MNSFRAPGDLLPLSICRSSSATQLYIVQQMSNAIYAINHLRFFSIVQRVEHLKIQFSSPTTLPVKRNGNNKKLDLPSKCCSFLCESPGNYRQEEEHLPPWTNSNERIQSERVLRRSHVLQLDRYFGLLQKICLLYWPCLLPFVLMAPPGAK